ncbi:hypothetical protein FACS1894185_1780 [Betaproteobacteria bacterium]|nr:hypothetical protein FACS1894185_1780 [Betaproteobacteria bacterium]
MGHFTACADTANMPPLPFPLPPAAFTSASRRVEIAHLFDWLTQGWAVFSAAPLLWMGMGSVYFFGLLLAPFLHYWALLPGLLLVPLTANLLLACDRLARDESGRERPDFFPLRLDWRVCLLGLQGTFALMLVGGCLWLTFAFLFAGFEQQSLNGVGVSAFGVLILFASLLLPAFLLAQAFCIILNFVLLLVVLHGMPILPAFVASVAAYLKNWRVFALFAPQLAVLLFFAILPAGLGLVVLIPVLCATLYAAYRDIFVGV